MKKLLTLFSVAALLFSCQNQAQKKQTGHVPVSHAVGASSRHVSGFLFAARVCTYRPAAQFGDGALQRVTAVAPGLVVVAVVKLQREPFQLFLKPGQVVT